MQGTARARDAGFLKAGNGAWHLDVAEYQHYEQASGVVVVCVCGVGGGGGLAPAHVPRKTQVHAPFKIC